MSTAPKFAASSQAKHEGWFSRRHRNSDAHSAAKNAYRNRMVDKEALAERPIVPRTKPQLVKMEDGVIAHTQNGSTYNVGKVISKGTIVIPEHTRMARKLRKANA